MHNLNPQHTAEDEKASMRHSHQSMQMSPTETKRIGKVYAKDAALDSVIASEMKRIQQAFDRKVVDHTEELVTKVQSGQPLVNKISEASVSKKR